MRFQIRLQLFALAFIGFSRTAQAAAPSLEEGYGGGGATEIQEAEKPCLNDGYGAPCSTDAMLAGASLPYAGRDRKLWGDTWGVIGRTGGKETYGSDSGPYSASRCPGDSYLWRYPEETSDEDDACTYSDGGECWSDVTGLCGDVCPGRSSYLWRYPEETSDEDDACTYSDGGECWNEKTQWCEPADDGDDDHAEQQPHGDCDLCGVGGVCILAPKDPSALFRMRVFHVSSHDFDPAKKSEFLDECAELVGEVELRCVDLVVEESYGSFGSYGFYTLLVTYEAPAEFVLTEVMDLVGVPVMSGGEAGEAAMILRPAGVEEGGHCWENEHCASNYCSNYKCDRLVSVRMKLPVDDAFDELMEENSIRNQAEFMELCRRYFDPEMLEPTIFEPSSSIRDGAAFQLDLPLIDNKPPRLFCADAEFAEDYEGFFITIEGSPKSVAALMTGFDHNEPYAGNLFYGCVTATLLLDEFYGSYGSYAAPLVRRNLEKDTRVLHALHDDDVPAYHCSCKAGYSGSGALGSCQPVRCPAKSHGENVPSGCWCNPGFSGVVIKTAYAPFYEESCESVKCPANSAGVMPFCTCNSGFHGVITPTMFSPFFSGVCKENVCVCKDGVAAKGGSWLQEDRASTERPYVGAGMCRATANSKWPGDVRDEARAAELAEVSPTEQAAALGEMTKGKGKEERPDFKAQAAVLTAMSPAVQAQVLAEMAPGNRAAALAEMAPADECCEADGTADCSVCNPHFRFEYDSATQTGKCAPCALGKYNLATQFQPLHQEGVYAEAGLYYAVKDKYFDAETSDVSTCQVDRDDFCQRIKPAAGGTETENFSKMEQCWKFAKCSWFAAEEMCSLRDPCVRKTKRACRSASHCNWGMKSGRCFEDTKIAYGKCERKNMNGCINDFFCKWQKSKGCRRHPCRQQNKASCDLPQCRWNSQHTRCDTAANSWYTDGATPAQKNWQWQSGEFIEAVSPKSLRGPLL